MEQEQIEIPVEYRKKAYEAGKIVNEIFKIAVDLFEKWDDLRMEVVELQEENKRLKAEIKLLRNNNSKEEAIN